MAMYLAFHRLKRPGDKVSDALNKSAPKIAHAIAAGETPCTCLKIWSPLAYGREDYLFCLWQADNPQDVKATLESFGLLDYFTLDCMRVDEIDRTTLASKKL